MRYLITSLALLALISISPALADNQPEGPRTVTVQGTGSVGAAPDMARITIGVTSSAAAADESLGVNSRAIGAVIQSLNQQGVAEADIQTLTFSINPIFRDRRGPSPSEPEIIGYVVENSLRITVRDLSRLGFVLDNVTKSGANNIRSIQFDVSEREKLALEALALAVKDASLAAETIANAAGVELGELRTISRGGAGQPRQFLARAEASSVPISPGSLTISANVSAVFAIR